MARESKRKRDERRFGKPERLADLFMEGAVSPPNWIPDDHVESWGSSAMGLREAIGRSCVIDADNVAEYAFGMGWKETRRREEFPCCAPPFPEIFMDITSPSGAFFEPTKRFGWFIESSELVSADLESEEASSPDLPDEGWKIEMTLVTQPRKSHKATAPCCVVHFVADKNGALVMGPRYEYPLTCCMEKTDENVSFFNRLTDVVTTYMIPALLTLCFMNCKGSALTAVEPNPVLNRERHKAGLKPFLRYHTINIEPMKRVLETEGNVESEGLKKALHICRGHFSTYTPDRPLFGRLAGTFWVPAHVRGSHKQGVVMSDYAVHAPASEPK